MTAAVPRLPDAVAYLRRRTLWRAAVGYGRWIGKAVGWPFVVYMLFWLVVYLVSGAQLLAPLEQPLPALMAQRLVPGAAGLFLLTPLLSKAPPVVLGRRDLYRLALAPVAPARALFWPLLAARLLRLFQGAALGLAWTVVSLYWFGQPAPWAAPALGLFALLHLELSWLIYAERQTRPGAGHLLVLVALLLSLLGLVRPDFGLGAALLFAAPWSLALPLTLAALGVWAVRRSLARDYPPRFAAQSLVLGELRAHSALLSTLLELPAASREERQRLLAQLHDRPAAASLKRTLPAPPPGWGAFGALLWRSLLHLYRRPWLSLLGLFGWLLAFAWASLDPLGGALGLLVHAVILGQLLSRLVGPSPPGLPLPLSPFEGSLGRAVPGAVLAAGVLLAVLLGAVAAGLPLTLSGLLTVATQPFLGLVLLGKLAAWLGVSPERFEALFGAALLTLTPGLVAAAFGAEALTPSLQLFLGWALAHLPAGEGA